ncbi:MAG TPA: energy transducer TonB [Terriglobales bacterium]|nr:energy transducer TonB [Terriglobales bacterium]
MEHSLFNPLPGQPPRSKYFAAGWSLQLLLIVAVLALNALAPKFRPPARRYVLTSLVRYTPEAPTAPQPAPRFHVNNAVQLPVMKPLLVAKAVLTAPVRKPNPPEMKVPEIKVESRLPQLPTPAPSRVVALDTFSSGSSAAPTTAEPAHKVQTGGFGDPEGVAPRSNPTVVAANIAAAGAFDLPSGSGRGNGSGGSTPGVVVSAGFGNGVATGGRRSGGPVQKSGFDAVYASSDSHKPAASIESTSTPVAILYKPKPAYTEEGRKQGIDGEVRLEVLFSAAGQVHVLRVLQGLGYGLDEQAVKAAEQIKFKPAAHAGQPVDSTAVVHIIFQLAS